MTIWAVQAAALLIFNKGDAIILGVSCYLVTIVVNVNEQTWSPRDATEDKEVLTESKAGTGWSVMVLSDDFFFQGQLQWSISGYSCMHERKSDA